MLFSPALLIDDEQNTQQKPLVRRRRDEVPKGTLEAQERELHQDWFLSALVLLPSLFVRTPSWPGIPPLPMHPAQDDCRTH